MIVDAKTVPQLAELLDPSFADRLPIQRGDEPLGFVSLQAFLEFLEANGAGFRGAVEDAEAAFALAATARDQAQVAAANAALYGTLFYNSGPKRFECIAHRGFSGEAPEETMAAYSQAVARGARSLEMDVQISSDGVPVCIHDDTVDRTTDGVGAVKAKTLAQLKALDAGSKFSARLAGCRIPTFAEVVDFAKTRVDHIYPEVKGYRTQADIDLMLAVIQDAGVDHMTTVQAFTLADLQYVRARNSKVGLCYLSGAADLPASLATFAALGGRLSFGGVHSQWTAAKVAAVRALGVDVIAYTIDERKELEAMLALGISRLFCDRFYGVN